jgi:hypothetical protein
MSRISPPADDGSALDLGIQLPTLTPAARSNI